MKNVYWIGIIAVLFGLQACSNETSSSPNSTPGSIPATRSDLENDDNRGAAQSSQTSPASRQFERQMLLIETSKDHSAEYQIAKSRDEFQGVPLSEKQPVSDALSMANKNRLMAYLNREILMEKVQWDNQWRTMSRLFQPPIEALEIQFTAESEIKLGFKVFQISEYWGIGETDPDLADANSMSQLMLEGYYAWDEQKLYIAEYQPGQPTADFHVYPPTDWRPSFHEKY